MIFENEGGDVEMDIGVSEVDFRYLHVSPILVVELGQRTVIGALSEESVS